MIKYITLPEKRTTIAYMKGTKYDALIKIEKVLGDTSFDLYHDKYLMPGQFRVEIVCDPRDEFNEKTGKELARKKLLRNYKRSLDKRINLIKKDLEILNEKVSKKLLTNV